MTDEVSVSGGRPARRARLWALAGLGLSAALTAALAATIALTVGCGDYSLGGCIDVRRPAYATPFDDPAPPNTLFVIPFHSYEQVPAEHAALLRANMDLLEAAPAAYAAWVRAHGTAASRDEMACRLILLVDPRDLGCASRTRIGDNPPRVYAEKNIQRVSTRGDGRPQYWDASGRRVLVYVHDDGPRYAQAEAELRRAAPAASAALDDALQALVGAREELIGNRSARTFLRYSAVPRGKYLDVEPVVSIGEAVPWRRAARFAALRRLTHAETRLQHDAPAEYAAWEQRGGAAFSFSSLDTLDDLATLIETAPEAYAARIRAIADLLSASPATFIDHFYGKYRPS